VSALMFSVGRRVYDILGGRPLYIRLDGRRVGTGAWGQGARLACGARGRFRYLAHLPDHTQGPGHRFRIATRAFSSSSATSKGSCRESHSHLKPWRPASAL